MIRTRLPNLSGKTDEEKIKELTKCVYSLIEELNMTGEDTRLPVGTEIMRYSETYNAGMNYGTWEMSGCVQTNCRVLMLYKRMK